MGRRPLGRKAMTNAERQRKFYAKQRPAKIWGANSDPAPDGRPLSAPTRIFGRLHPNSKSRWCAMSCRSCRPVRCLEDSAGR
jgi:hypothetical protein